MSPYKSEAQRRKIHQLAKEGKIDPAKVRKLDDETGNKKLPERVGEKDTPKKDEGGNPNPHQVIHDTMEALNS